MIGIPTLLASLLTKGAAIRALAWPGVLNGTGRRVRRAVAGPAGQALGVALIAAVALAVVGLLMSRAASQATDVRDGVWKSKLALQRATQILAQRERDRAAEAAAQNVRRWLSSERDDAVNRVAELERHLAELAAKPGGGDPVIYPRTIVRSLRK